MDTVAGAMRTIDNLVDFNNADILSALNVNALSNSNNDLVQFMEGPSNLTINSNGSIGQHNDEVGNFFSVNGQNPDLSAATQINGRNPKFTAESMCSYQNPLFKIVMKNIKICYEIKLYEKIIYQF